jgi:hypothetical protein
VFSSLYLLIDARHTPSRVINNRGSNITDHVRDQAGFTWALIIPSIGYKFVVFDILHHRDVCAGDRFGVVKQVIGF